MLGRAPIDPSQEADAEFFYDKVRESQRASQAVAAQAAALGPEAWRFTSGIFSCNCLSCDGAHDLARYRATLV